MKIRIERGSLAHALEAVVGVAEGKGVTSYVLIEAREHTLTLTATDNETSSRIVEPAEVRTDGRALLHAKKLLDIVKSLPGGMVYLVVEGVWGTLTAGSARFKLVGLDPTEFQDVPEPNMSADVEISAEYLGGIIRRTLYAVNEHDARFVLNGLFLEVADERLTVVGTDGHRLAVETWEGLASEVDWFGIVPKKAIQQLAKRLNGVERVSLGVTYGRMFHAWVGGYRLTSRMIEGKYPNYKKLVPQKTPANTLTVDREELAEAVKRVALVATGLIRLEYTESGAVLSAQSPEHGEARETVEASYVGEPFQTGFQFSYLNAILVALDGPTVVLQQEGPTGTLLVTDPSVKLCRTLVMPIRLG